MPERTASKLASQVAALRGTHAILDPASGARPAGEGHFAFLEETDTVSAAALGHTTALAVADSREQGDLPISSKSDVVEPHIVWYPNEALVNPVYQPGGAGQWAYLTPHASRIAARDFGDREGFGTAGVGQPTAAQVFRVREEFREMVRKGEYPHDLTEGVNLVWVPGKDGDEVACEGQSAAAIAGDIGFGFDAVTGLPHEPTNGGMNDQTGLPDRNKHYQTRQFGDIRVTLDRYAAKVNHVEPHKLWYYNGIKWLRWTRAQEIDWDDADEIVDLNKWREQACRRSGWALKRGEQRENYTKEQRDYLFDMIVKNNGLAPGRPYKELTDEFNERFKLEGEVKRTVGGVQTLISKLCREYEKYGGKQKSRGEDRSKADDQTKEESEEETTAESEEQKDAEDERPEEEGQQDQVVEDTPAELGETALSKEEYDSGKDASGEIDYEMET